MVVKSPAAKGLKAINLNLPNKDQVEKLRKSADIQCKNLEKGGNPCKPLQQVCLFNIKDDPCEKNNVVFKYPDVVRIMERTLEMYKATEVPRGNKPIDPRADPKFYNYTWTNWWDLVEHTQVESGSGYAEPENIFSK